MEPEKLLEILRTAGRLKTTKRHCWTEEGRAESVADHSWRITLLAMLLADEEAFQDTDMNKVIRMCLIHDLGEAFTGDIPTFEKTGGDEKTEEALYHSWVEGFPEAQRSAWTELLREMEALETMEAKTSKALDKLEALISHNESDIRTWLPLEYDLQLTYGKENVKFSPYLQKLREAIDVWTLTKIREEGPKAEGGTSGEEPGDPQ